MEFQLSILKFPKMMLLQCCTQHVIKFGKLSSGHRTRTNVSFPIPKKGNAKECSKHHTIALISHASKGMLKILQVRLVQFGQSVVPNSL